MADRNGLKFVGLLFASVTLAVMLTTALVVKGHADGRYTLEGAKTAARRARRVGASSHNFELDCSSRGIAPRLLLCPGDERDS